MAGSNIIEFRLVRKWNEPEAIVLNDQRVQFRTKDVIIGVLGVTLGVWSEWQDFDGLAVVDIVSAP
jgi:hypothetical protein